MYGRSVMTMATVTVTEEDFMMIAAWNRQIPTAMMMTEWRTWEWEWKWK